MSFPCAQLGKIPGARIGGEGAPAAARIADGDRAGHLKSARRSMARSSAKLAGQSTVIFGMPDKKYRVHHAVMRRAVRTDQARAVDRKDGAVQSAQRHIVQQLVVGALEKARIHGEHRERALLCKARRHRGGVSLGDADVKKSGRGNARQRA